MKITKRKVMQDIYAVNCTRCGNEITGNSEATVIYNVRIHMDAKHVKTQGEAQDEKSPRPSHSSKETKQ